MVHHTCMDCQRGFIATSREEAQDEYEKLAKEGKVDAVGGTFEEDFESAVEGNVVAYAEYCPYCGSGSVEAR